MQRFHSNNEIQCFVANGSVNIAESRLVFASAVSYGTLFHCRRNGWDRTEKVGHEINEDQKQISLRSGCTNLS